MPTGSRRGAMVEAGNGRWVHHRPRYRQDIAQGTVIDLAQPGDQGGMGDHQAGIGIVEDLRPGIARARRCSAGCRRRRDS